MRRELGGFVIDNDAGAVTLTKIPSVILRRLVPAAALLSLCLGGGITSAVSLLTGDEWATMVGPQKALSVGIIVVLTIMSVVFGRALYFALDRGFRVQASNDGVSVRHHHFSRMTIPRSLIAGVRVRGRTLQPARKPRACQVRVELAIHELDDALDLFGVGPAHEQVRDEPENRERLTKMGLELGDVLANALDVPREWIDFGR